MSKRCCMISIVLFKNCSRAHINMMKFLLWLWLGRIHFVWRFTSSASELLALSWILHPNCCRILFTELYKHCKAAFTVFHQINDNRDNNLSWNLNEQMKKITYIHDIFYFLQSIFFRTKLEKKNNLAWFMVDLGSHLACSTLQLKSKWWAVRNHLRERHRIASWWHCAKL